MPLQCADIETLVPTYLDDELAEEETRELEDHVTACAGCRQQLAGEARFHTGLRQRLSPPALPAVVRDRVTAALDREDWSARRQPRRWSWALPGTATLAAAAALLLFVLSDSPAPPNEPPVAYDAVRQHMRRPPIEVQGTAVSPWIQRHFSPQVKVPRFEHDRISLRGARLSHLRGRDAVQFYYYVARGRNRHDLSMLVFDASGIDFHRTFRSSEMRTIGGREVWLDERFGYGVVAHKGPDGLGYLLISDMSGDQLTELLRHSDLLSRPGPGR
jgi:anti-sigma factor RsiW